MGDLGFKSFINSNSLVYSYPHYLSSFWLQLTFSVPPSSFPRAAVTKYQKTEWLRTTKIYSLTVLKAESPKARCWQSHAPSKGFRERSFLPLPGFWWSSAIFVILQLAASSFQFPPLLSHGFLPYVSMFLCLSLHDHVRIVVIGFGLALTQCALFSTNCIYKDLTFFIR